MSILPCLHPVPALPGARSRKQILLPAVHGADEGARAERLSDRTRRLAVPSPAPFPMAGRQRRTCGASGPDSGKPADGRPAVLAPAAPSDAVPGRPTPGYCHRLDIAGGVGAGYRRSGAAGQPVLLPGPHRSRDTGRNQHGADGRRPGTPPPARATPKRRIPGGGGCRDHRPGRPRT